MGRAQRPAQRGERNRNGSFAPIASDSARRIVQSSRASPGGKTASAGALTRGRPSILTVVAFFGIRCLPGKNTSAHAAPVAAGAPDRDARTRRARPQFVGPKMKTIPPRPPRPSSAHRATLRPAPIPI